MAKKKPPDTGLILAEPTPASVLQVKQWIVEGQQAADILQSVEATFPGERPEVLLSAALEQLGAESAELDCDVARGFLLNAYRELYRRAAEINDFANALGALRSFERVIK
ncbi:MAG: hypothetical protein NTY19_04805 [Planctomycetota bacterium]|nr:hypothetical protein [Planctomycetota bacterium]